ncbi:transposase [Streptomyces sp. BR123]|uniref:transposase n=1 Tax=Streptomyces sp. BR123 TaxID=2749828 RepID=UPI0015C4469D|nr:transposase [Streptomyces sp. BR123]
MPTRGRATWTGRKAEDRRQRCLCRIPEVEHHRPGWQFALDILDELAGIALQSAVLTADCSYGAYAAFRRGPATGSDLVLHVKAG